jgi:O-6-methylguanine DNA methyltransferase
MLTAMKSPPSISSSRARKSAADDAACRRSQSASCRPTSPTPAFAFGLPLRPAGTTFQRRVWEQISAIPTGRTHTYGEVAKNLKNAPRAVGQACGANPYPIVVPCHRVVATSGGLGGFARERGGFLLDVKRWLLTGTKVSVPPRPADLAEIDNFCDALWLEDGLAKATLDSYRSDLGRLAVAGRTWPRSPARPVAKRR